VTPGTAPSGGRAIDVFADRLRAGTMPPGGQPQPDGDTRAVLVDWATCGEGMAPPPDGPPPGGFDVNRPILPDDGQAPPDTDFFELRADAFEVTPDMTDHYECFTFELPVSSDRFIRRIETIADDVRVLHHTVLIPGSDGREPGQHGRCENENALDIRYAWAPGQGALSFDEGGLRIQPGERMTLQIHYNNAAGHPDVRDSSGVRIYHGPPEPAEAEVGMLTLGPIGFTIDEGQHEVTGFCRVPQDMEMIASFPHMHEVGWGFVQDVEREDGEMENVIDLRGWDFNSQFLYETPVSLRVGDVVRTTCVYRNETGARVRMGPNTADEMCFNFAYVRPPPPVAFCNSNQLEPPQPYVPGECAPPGADGVEAPDVLGPFEVGEAPALGGGPPPAPGLYVLSDLVLWTPGVEVGPFTLQADASSVLGKGVLGVDPEGRLSVDTFMTLNLSDGLAGVERSFPVSLGGAARWDGEAAVTVALDCGSDGESDFAYRTDGAAITFEFRIRSMGADFRIRMTFTPPE
jgi:hypothetical protein